MTIQATAKISAEQYYHIEEPEGLRFELVNGVLSVSPSPGSFHSYTYHKLYMLLGVHIEAHDLSMLFGELDAELGPFDVRRPDMMFIAKERLEEMEPGCTMRSDDVELVVEVLSPSSVRTDREDKLQQYAKAGIRYYWIVDPQQRTFEAYTLAGKSYRSHVKASGNAVVHAKPFVDLAIPLQKLWWR